MTRRADHDCVLAVVVFFLPILPLRPLHTFDWVGQQCRTAPIRWSLWLVIRSLLRPWLIAVLAVALVAAVLYLVPSLGREVVGRRFLTKYDEGLWVALGSIAGSALGLSLLGMTSRRSRDVRLVLGRHGLGSSDPGTWPRELVEQVTAACPYAGSLSITTVRRLLDQDRPVQAMWLARLAKGLGLPWAEQATDAVLNDARVRSRLAETRKAPWKRSDAFAADPEPWWPQFRSQIIEVPPRR
jgi:hypothetical protein